MKMTATKAAGEVIFGCKAAHFESLSDDKKFDLLEDAYKKKVKLSIAAQYTPTAHGATHMSGSAMRTPRATSDARADATRCASVRAPIVAILCVRSHVG